MVELRVVGQEAMQLFVTKCEGLSNEGISQVRMEFVITNVEGSLINLSDDY